MKRIQNIMFILLCLSIMRPLFAHNEYIKLDGNGNITLTTNLSEAIKWDD